MYYWRKNAFNLLAEAAQSASAVPAWSEYALFCEALEQGVRKKAFAHLDLFIEQGSGWPFGRKKEFVSWLYTFISSHDDTYMLLPHPLSEKLVKPVLMSWIEMEPDDAEPHRWLGTPEHLREAIRLNPADDIARCRLVETILRWIGYAVHELPHGYLGDPEEDMEVLAEAEAVAAGISDEARRGLYASQVGEMRAIVIAYMHRGDAG
ncbi:MAG TPA: hypothetical protein VHI13_01950 [Candidatus Kapabacteria bacterium]|nr:hypothetical protein [Candidatus Kapabacteria bacterium]